MMELGEGKQLFACQSCGDLGTEASCSNCRSVDTVAIRCSECSQPILTGQARYTAGELRNIYRHYDCKKKSDAQLDRDLRKIGRADVADMLKRLKI